VISRRTGIYKGLQSLDDNGHVGPEIGFVLHAQRRHRRELNRRDSVKKTEQRAEQKRFS
jgi:hypothetical protein